MDWTDSRQEFHSPRVLPSADLPKIGRVTKPADGALPWHVTGLTADAKEIDDFMLTLATNDCSPQTLRSYAFNSLRWCRFLAAVG